MVMKNCKKCPRFTIKKNTTLTDKRKKWIRVKLFSINKLYITQIDIVKNDHWIQNKKRKHEVVTTDRKNWLQTSAAIEVFINMQNFNSIHKKLQRILLDSTYENNTLHHNERNTKVITNDQSDWSSYLLKKFQ